MLTRATEEGDPRLGSTAIVHVTPGLDGVSRAVRWSADGRTIATCGEDRLVKIWNAETLTIRQTLPKQPDWASGLAISRGLTAA